MNQERLIGTAKKLDKLLKAIQIVNCAAIVLLVCGFIILNIAHWIIPYNVNTAESLKITMGEFTLELAGAAVMEFDLSYGLVNCILAVALLMILWIGLGYARKIMSQMMEGNPFDRSVGVYLKKLGIVALIYGIAENVGAWMMTSVKMNHYQLERLVDGEKILSVTPEYQLELGFLVVFFVFLLASYIFHYGAELQQLSDETL